MRRPLALIALLVVALLASVYGGAASAQTPTLHGTVGPEFSIVLRDAQGNRVTKLDPGTYEVEVEDLSDVHSFHLQGPGVDERTEVDFTGKVRWTVTFRDGTYVYRCDPHPSLRGSFVVGNPQPATPPPPPAAVTPKTRLVVTAGPAEVITLKTAAGKSVSSLRRGTYTVVVRDRSRIHNVHLIAPGFNKKTAVPYVGTQTWKVPLVRVGTLRYRCDPHAFVMKGSAKIVG
jgi:plastocyanin